MITLGIDTSESRGSVAVYCNGSPASLSLHESSEDYSSWLLPTVEKCLHEAGVGLRSLDLFTVATGPGSFTGLRVGITAVKAWAELYRKPVVGVSRLEVMARAIPTKQGFVAASFNAQRGQIFGGLYRLSTEGDSHLVDQEMVITADGFVNWVSEKVGDARTHWVALDPELLQQATAWQRRVELGDILVVCAPGLAAGVAQLGEERARRGELSDALHLDANYVRRSDAELFWKDPVSHGR